MRSSGSEERPKVRSQPSALRRASTSAATGWTSPAAGGRLAVPEAAEHDGVERAPVLRHQGQRHDFENASDRRDGAVHRPSPLALGMPGRLGKLSDLVTRVVRSFPLAFSEWIP
jgi:hypothetical protein